MGDEHLSRLLREIRDRGDDQMPEDAAIDRYGEETVGRAKTLDLVDVDDGSFWRVERVLYLTAAGRARSRGGRAIPLRRGSDRVAGWLRAAFEGLRLKRP